MWIEQLVAKSRDIGIPITAVSSAGFTESAMIKAQHYGIETRIMSEITQAEMAAWVRVKDIVHHVTFPVVKTVHMAMFTDADEQGGTLHSSVLEQIAPGGGDAPVIVRNSDETAFRICQILDAVRSQLNLHDGVPDDGTVVRKEVVINVARGLFHILTNAGCRDLARLTLGVDVRCDSARWPAPEVGFAYKGDARPTVHQYSSAWKLGQCLVLQRNR